MPIAQPTLTGMHVVLVGNPVDGFTVYGPFKTGEAASHYGQCETDDSWCIAPLHAPEA